MSTATSTPTFPVPPGHKAVKERNATILLPTSNTTFLNPIQEYNRDLSVAVIKRFMLDTTDAARKKFDARRAKRMKKGGKQAKESTEAGEPAAIELAPFRPAKYTIIEALSATGLRSIRYAQELPEAGVILANDFSHDAVESMRQNVRYNDVEAIEKIPVSSEPSTSTVGGKIKEECFAGRGLKKSYTKAGVVVNEGDAMDLLYRHRGEGNRVDVVDLDPYGTAAPFIDGAVQAVNDGGLLCVTCTDLSVLAGGNYPEKCYSNYGGMPVRAEFSHEGALRLLLHTIATSAARYGKHTVPLLSLSIDFYIRVFVKVIHSPQETKRTASRTGSVYICTYCQTHHAQPFGRAVAQPAKGKEGVRFDFKTCSGPPLGNEGCEHCGHNSLLAGPMWLGQLHDGEFVERLLEQVQEQQELYGTYQRIKGMLTMAKEELPNALFYFTPAKVASMFHSQCPPFVQYCSAIRNAGFSVSRSHAIAGSIKTDAPQSLVFDVVREFIKTSPVRRDKISEGSPANKLLDKAMTHEIDFTLHPDIKTMTSKKDLVRYQMNPTENWGPASRARPVGKTVAAAAALQDVDMSEAVELGLASEEAVDPIAEVTEKNDEGLDVEQVEEAEDVIEVTESTTQKRVASDVDDRSRKKVRMAGSLDEEEAMMNEL